MVLTDDLSKKELQIIEREIFKMKLLVGKRITLQDDNKFARVIDGKLEVYAVTRRKKSFRQIFLTENSTGDAAFSAMDDFGYIDFLIYAVKDSEIEFVEKNYSAR